MTDRERERGRERDLVLAPNEFAFISDETKGNINVYVGPHKTSLANTDQPVVFDPATKRFDRCSLEQATRTLSIAPEGWYVVLKNPARDKSHPRTGALNNLPELDTGRKVNVPGPISFSLWPGQMARVLQGHHLRSNQYLLVRVYDEEAAKVNWRNAVIKPQTAAPEGAPEATATEGAPLDPERLLPELTMGKQLVIRGTDVSFYIPPTGVEVAADASGSHVREAITLERLEYCILLGEDGNKRYIQGPAVVFPRPTETFVERHNSRKFRAIELNENSGIYLKVIAPYVDEATGQAHKVGDELFLTGREQMIYFPRPEHALVRYGEQEIHYAVAIPAGEARYVLDRLTGQIRLQRGPCMYLPDPRREVIVRRVLDPRQVELWFPGNVDAIAHNQLLGELERKKREEGGPPGAPVAAPAAAAAKARLPAREGFAGDDFRRGTNFTQPRTIVLDTRFDGAVALSVWTGYAVLVVGKSGERKVIVGPSTYLLEYDETLQTLKLSTGVPKRDEDPYRTVYLRVLNNKVSDEVEAETRDLCRVRLRLSYRVNFEGEAERWFDVENYVKFFTEHLRSLLRNAIKQYGVEAFYASAVSVVRDVVLGAQNEEGRRAGRFFSENGLRVYDVEVLDVALGDDAIADLLVEAQHAAVRQALDLASNQRKLEAARQGELVRQQIAELEASTRQKSLALGVLDVARSLELELAKVRAEATARDSRREAELSEQQAIDAIHRAELGRRKSDHELALEVAGSQLEQQLRRLGADVQATVDKARAVSPDLVAALQAFGDRALAERMAQSMAPLAILGGESVAEVLARLLQGTPLARLLAPANGATSGNGNGNGGE